VVENMRMLSVSSVVQNREDLLRDLRVEDNDSLVSGGTSHATYDF
jgi:hypothetical protein